MNKDLSQVEFYFPKGSFNNKEELVDKTISLMEKSGSVDYSGYENAELLKQGLLDHIGNGDIKEYKTISDETKREIENIIHETILKCNEKLLVPTKNFIFAHPYFSTKEEDVFEGVMAVAVYSCVFHLFINLDQFTKESLENTVAHELNHTIYYYRHYDDLGNYTLLDEILLEGLAENFREQYFNPKTTMWAGSLKREEALDLIKKNDHGLLNSKDQKVIKDFLFGNETYQKWTGYSVGYWLVKEFIKNNPELSWEELMKIEKEGFKNLIQLNT